MTTGVTDVAILCHTFVIAVTRVTWKGNPDKLSDPCPTPRHST